MNAEAVAAFLIEWLKKRGEEARTDGAVFGLSGGIDSACVGALCARAFPGRCQGLIMPAHSDLKDKEDALIVAKAFGIPVQTVDLGPIYDQHLAALRQAHEQALAAPADGEEPGAGAPEVEERRLNLAVANLKPRLRMTTLYFFANLMNRLVVGTGNRSELTVGYFTKYGDGGVDLLPLGGLVKTQVRELAVYLGVPRRVIDKPPSAGLWSGQTDEGEMGATYAELDRYILDGVAPGALKAKLDRMARSAAHKCAMPLLAEVPADLLGRS